MPYTPQEKLKFYTWFVECNRSFKEFVIRVRREMGIRAEVPSKPTILQWCKKFVETGSGERKKVVRTKLVFHFCLFLNLSNFFKNC